MQAEEIMQRKEWNNLSENERRFLKEIAADEQEYNLLKQILQVSAEETFNVPLLDNKIKVSIDAAISKQKSKSNQFIWYAAAGVLLVIFSTILVYKYNRAIKQSVFVETKNLHKDLLPAETKVESKKNDSLQNNADENKIIAEVKIKSDSNSSDNKIYSKTAPLLSNKNKYIAINTTVSSDPRLLSLVTEVY